MRDPIDLNLDVEELNQEHFVSVEAGRVMIFSERFDRALKRFMLERSSAADFRLLYGNRFVWETRESRNGSTTAKTPLGKFWIEHPDRRQYREIVFDPDPERVNDPDVFNLWRGFQVEAKEGDWSLWRRHLLEIGAAGDQETFEFLLDWFAWMVRYPHRPAETAIVWRGRQGSGKGTIARVMGRVVGQHFIHIHNVKHLVGHFNQHLRDAVLVFSDEALWAGDKASEGILKAMITEPTLMIEGKGRDVIPSLNRVHLLMATNNEWAAPVGVDDRRFSIVDVPDTYIGNKDYFGRLYDHLDEGGLSAFLYFLQEREVNDPPTPPRSVAALSSALKQKLHTMAPAWQWWHEKLEDAQLLKDKDGWPEEVPKTELHDDFIRFAERLNISRRASETTLGLALDEMTPGVRTRRKRGLGFDDKRTRVWVIPSLKKCRAFYASALRMPGLYDGLPDEHGDE
jgi:hypothetical protein